MDRLPQDKVENNAPPPETAALDPAKTEALVLQALEAARSKALTGKSLTPFLLDRLNAASGGRTLEANRALIEANAALGAEIAKAYVKLDRDTVNSASK